MASNPTLTQVVVEMIGTAIKFPQQINATSFLPNAVSINNRSASTIQVGPAQNGPFILMGQFTLAQLPWTYGRSIWVQEVGGPAAHIATEFVQVTFLEVSPAGAVGAGNITSYAPSGWGSVGPGNTLANINAGDPFNFGQVQQFVNLLTGVMTGQAVNVANTVETSGTSGSFIFMDRDQVGGDFFDWHANLGQAILFSSVAAGALVTVSEAGRLTAPTTGASAKPLLNFVPLTSGNVTTINGPAYSTATLQTLTGVPTSAVAVAINTHFDTINTGILNVAITSDNLSANGVRYFFPLTLSGARAYTSGVTPCAANGQVYWTVGSTGTANAGDSLTILALGYYEPS